MPEQYQYRDTYFGPRSVAAATVASELARLRGDGDLTARRVVEAAVPTDAPLHPVFVWDDHVAAEQYRLIQARTLIRSVVVVSESVPPRSVYVHVPDAQEHEGKYVPLVLVAESTDEYARALGAAQRYLDSAEARFRELRALAESRGDKIEALAIATQGFSTVRQALELLKIAS